MYETKSRMLEPRHSNPPDRLICTQGEWYHRDDMYDIRHYVCYYCVGHIHVREEIYTLQVKCCMMTIENRMYQ